MSQITSKYILKCNRCRSVMTTEDLNCPQCEGYNPYYGMSDDEVASLNGNSKADTSDNEFIVLKDAVNILKCKYCKSVMTTKDINCPQCGNYNPYYGMSDDKMASLKGNSKASFKALKDAAKNAKMHQGEHDYFAFFKVGIPIIIIIVIFIVGLIMSVLDNSVDDYLLGTANSFAKGYVKGLFESLFESLLIPLLIALVLWIISLFNKK